MVVEMSYKKSFVVCAMVAACCQVINTLNSIRSTTMQVHKQSLFFSHLQSDIDFSLAF